MSIAADLIAQQFENCYFIRLEDIAEAYLGIDPETAIRYARENKLGFALFKLHDSPHAPWLTTADDLAEYIDRKRQQTSPATGKIGKQTLREIYKGIKT